MEAKKILKNKYVIATVIIALLTVVLEIFVFNFSSFRTCGTEPVVIADNVDTVSGNYESANITINGSVKNVYVKMTTNYTDVSYVTIALTDEGDKYEYALPEYSVCNGVETTGFTNIYPFGNVNTIRAIIRAEDGCDAHIDSITVNASKPVDFKILRFLIVFAIMWLGYMLWTKSPIHEIYFDKNKAWQWAVTVVVIIALIALGRYITKADKLLMATPWPHHKQYQELARSLDKGTVELTEQYVDSKLLEVENPYDTITLFAEDIQYSMDYAFYDGHYYAYFGIMPELLFYYPYYKLRGEDMQNYQVMTILYVLLVIGVFLTITGLVIRYAKSLPYVFYLLLSIVTILSSNFIYLSARSDIYNVPILTAVVCIFMGLGLWLMALNTSKRWIRCVCITIGALAMAMVAGCRPQLLIFSGLAFLLFFFEEGFKNRKLFNRGSVVETICFCVPYMIIAGIVCWYNYARFGNIFDFGATYSLTTNDMNHRGFNLNRLLRSMYCYLIQPATVNTDFPYLNASSVVGNYMGRFLSEYTYGGILVANTLMVSLWLAMFSGLKKLKGTVKNLTVYLVISAIIIAAFDANFAGVLYRYTCDFAPAFILAAVLLWMMFFDRGRAVINYDFAARIGYVCIVVALFTALFTFLASGSDVCLANDNKPLYYGIAEYFRF